MDKHDQTESVSERERRQSATDASNAQKSANLRDQKTDHEAKHEAAKREDVKKAVQKLPVEQIPKHFNTIETTLKSLRDKLPPQYHNELTTLEQHFQALKDHHEAVAG